MTGLLQQVAAALAFAAVAAHGAPGARNFGAKNFAITRFPGRKCPSLRKE